MYPLLDCFTHEGDQINCHEGGLVVSEFATIAKADESIEIEADENVLQAFLNQKTCSAVALAFFFDGTGDHLPDMLLLEVSAGIPSIVLLTRSIMFTP